MKDAKCKILWCVMEKYGEKRVIEETGISRVTPWRMLERVLPVKPKHVAPLLELLTLEKFERLVAA